MDLQLKDKHVLIAGGSRGIGYACAQEFLLEGCLVSLVGRDAGRLDSACASLDPERQRVAGFSADLEDAAAALHAIDQAEQQFGPIDILVNSAGAARRAPFAELRPEDWDAAMRAKFMTYINMMDPVIKRMGARNTGVIVNVVGQGGKIPISTHLPGGAANAALMLASAGLALAYAPQGVRVNALNPSRTATERLKEGIEAEARQKNMSPEAVLAEAQSKLLHGRLASPEDIAAAVVFLASPRAGYISGTVLAIDGGSRPMVV